MKYIVAGTGYENRQVGIKKWCKAGLVVKLKRELNNEYDENAVAVYIPVRIFFGFIKSEFQIGYIKKAAAERMSKRLDAGEQYIGIVESYYAPLNREFPRVTLDIKFIKK
jgi:HIRAN domain-containing protein